MIFLLSTIHLYDKSSVFGRYGVVVGGGELRVFNLLPGVVLNIKLARTIVY